MNKYWTVVVKETIDNLRDRRTLLSSLTIAALGPVAVVAMMTFVLNNALGRSDEPVPVTVTGAEFAPSLLDYLRQRNLDLSLSDLPDPESAVRDGEESLVLRIPPDYAERFSQGASVAVDVIYDSSDLGPIQRHSRSLRGAISQYSATLGRLRLSVRGVDPLVAAPLVVQVVDVSSPASRALTLLSTIPYLIVLAIFMGGYYLAIDTTAGERENHSLEPLLTQPVARSSLVLGKLTATAIFAALVLLTFLIVFALVIPIVPFHKVGMRVDINAASVLRMFLISLPLVFLAAGLLTVVASFAKSYKEAQTYLSLLIFIPTLPIIVTQFMDLEVSWWLMLVPSQSQATLINLIIAREPIPALYVLLSATATIAAGCVFAYMAVRLYSRERILG